MRLVVLPLAVIGLLVGTACRDRSSPPTDSAPVTTAAPAGEVPAPADPATSRSPVAVGERSESTGRPRIVFLGDSLTAGLGLDANATYPAILQRRLDERGYRYEVVNAGVSGDTSAGGVRRLDWSLDGDVEILVVALGGNDGLRGLPTDDLRRNLSSIIERAATKGITVILAGMEAPPNNGAEYAQQFRRVYEDLAKAHQVRYLPFLLQGVAGTTELNQADGIHPNARGARVVADLVWGSMEPELARPAPPVDGARRGPDRVRRPVPQ